MADNEPKKVELKDGQVIVDEKTLTGVLEKLADMEKAVADADAKRAGLEAMFAEQQDTNTVGEKKLRERKTFEPAFRTVTLKKMPIAGNPEDTGYVIGWTSRGAYQKVNRDGVAPVVVDYVDVFFLGRERNKEGMLQAESIPLLTLLNAPEVTCKVLEIKKVPRKEPTGEEIRVTEFDMNHGQQETGDIIDGWVAFTDITLVIQVPGQPDPIEVDEKYVNS